MRLITVKLVGPKGNFLKVNANEVPIWRSRGWRLADEVSRTSGGEPQSKQPTDEQPKVAKVDKVNKPANDSDSSINDVII